MKKTNKMHLYLINLFQLNFPLLQNYFYQQMQPFINHLTPNGHYMGRTTQLISRCCILYINSTNIRTEYFKHSA